MNRGHAHFYLHNDTFIAYYSYPVGLICSPIQRLHDIIEAHEGGKGTQLALEEQYGCHTLPCAAVAVDAKLDVSPKAERCLTVLGAPALSAEEEEESGGCCL